MMISHRLRCLTCLVLLACLWITSAGAQPQTLKLLGRSSVDGYDVKLSDADSRVLRQKGRLVLAVSKPDYPPFDITTNDDDYEGLTADYAGLLKQLLHVEIEVQRYASRGDAVRAIKDGKADLLGTANRYETEDPQL
ncbi:transporter substrate-binding domain-containing protein, partial [Pseudomonas fluorescens]